MKVNKGCHADKGKIVETINCQPDNQDCFPVATSIQFKVGFKALVLTPGIEPVNY